VNIGLRYQYTIAFFIGELLGTILFGTLFCNSRIYLVPITIDLLSTIVANV
jgi:hypothetical protein